MKSFMASMCLGLFACLFVAACSSGRTSGPSTEDCEELRDHMVDVRLGANAPDVDQHRVAMAGALGTDFIDRCVSDRSEAYVSCALGASSSNELSACSR